MQVYSNVRSFKGDLVKYKPHFLVAVPRLFETIYKGALNNFAAQPESKQKLVAAFTAISTLYMGAKRVRNGMVIRDKVRLLNAMHATRNGPLYSSKCRSVMRKLPVVS